MSEGGARPANNLWHRMVYVVVVSSEHEVLVQRRAHGRDPFGGSWDIAVCGAPMDGEPWLEAAVRTVQTSLSLPVEPPDLHHVGDGKCEAGGRLIAGLVYRFPHDGPVEFSSEEVTETASVPVRELNAWAGAPEREVAPDSLSFVLPLVLGHPPFKEG